MTSTPTAEATLSAEQIDHVTALFYDRIRGDDTLGPVFAATVTDDAWPAHVARVASFWRSTLLGENSYQGNPLKAHNQASTMQLAHFEPWLALLDTVLSEELSPDQARAWSMVAHRLGKRLSMGMQGKVPPHLQE